MFHIHCKAQVKHIFPSLWPRTCQVVSWQPLTGVIFYSLFSRGWSATGQRQRQVGRWKRSRRCCKVCVMKDSQDWLLETSAPTPFHAAKLQLRGRNVLQVSQTG